MGDVKVLYIGGTGRTGSTVLEKILGQAPGVFAGGELTFLWRFFDTGYCSCGAAIRACPVWATAFEDAFGGFGGVDPEQMIAWRRRFSSRHLPLMASRRLRERLMQRLGDFPATVERLYRSIASTTGSRLIIDSSKEPHYSYILRSRVALDVRFLHLVRDPRAVAYSWGRAKRQRGIAGDEYMERRRPSVSAVYFDVSNLAAELMWSRSPGSYLRMRYEDLVEDPPAALGRIEDLVEESLHLDLRGGSIQVGPTHSAWGNPNRFEDGLLTLAPDTEWRARMGRIAMAVVSAFTLPFLPRYGYPLWPRG